MKKNVVNASVEVMQSVTESKQTKGFKPANSENATIVKPSIKDTKNAFIAFIRTKEEIGLNKFFKLFEAFKKDSPKAYGEFLAANNLDFSLDYSFKWFAANCPSMEINGKKEFAKWVKVTENTPANEKEEYNRFTEKGVQQTLKAYCCTRANYEQYLSMFMDVIREIKRTKRLAEKARKESEKLANAEKLAKAKAERIEKLKIELAKLQAA